MLQRYAVRTLNKNGIFLMIRDLVINDVQVRIWQSVVPAPVVDHPIRAQRHHPHRQAEFDIIAALMPQPWSWDDIAKDPTMKTEAIDYFAPMIQNSLK